MRFSRWFPEPRAAGEEPPSAPAADTEEGHALDAVIVALTTVAEVVDEVAGSPLGRQADAIEILERLLPDARLSPARYHAVLHAYPAQVSRALAAVHRAVRPPGPAAR